MSDQCGKISYIFIFLFLASFILLFKFWVTGDNRTTDVSEVVSKLLNTQQEPVLKYVLHKDAKCIDGSPPAYYIRKGYGDGFEKWIVFFEGGGWCYDMEQCYLRSKTVLGSSNDYTATLPKDGLKFYLSSDEKVNPLMYNWNTVLVKYCDGGSFAGDAVRTYKVFIHLFKILNEIFKLI